MTIHIRFLHGPRAGERLEFGPEVRQIRFGRSPDTCQVLFPPDLTAVGREHCTLIREPGGARLQLPAHHEVLVNGVSAHDGQWLTGESDLQLGPGGPQLVVSQADGGPLPPTAPQSRRDGAHTMALGARRQARQGAAVGAAAAALVVGLSVVGWLVSQRQDQTIGEVKQGVKVVADEVKTVAGDVETIAEQTDLQRERVLALESRSLAHEASLKTLPAQWEPLVNRVAESVYLVLIRDRDGIESAQATAWVADRDRGLLGTNGHVAELMSEVPEGGALVARSSGAEPHDIIITSVTMHPGYTQFAELWSEFDPVLPYLGSEGYSSISAAGPACDVALLHAAEGSKLGPTLPVASAESLASLRPGEAVAYVGFPMEGLALGGVSLQNPAPRAKLGYISAVTDYFGGSTSDPDTRLLVHHALATAGGASGSPIINDRGEVVAVHNAGNPIAETDEKVRIGSPADIFFAQRADLVRELLDGQAEARQAPRSLAWREDVRRRYLPRHGVERSLVRNRTTRAWLEEVALDELLDISPREVLRTTVKLASDGAGGGLARTSFTPDRDAHFHVLALAESSAAQLWVDVMRDSDSSMLVSGDSYAAGWHDEGRFSGTAATPVTIIVHGLPGDAPFELIISQAELSPVSPDEMFARRVQRWRQSLEWSSTSVSEPEEIDQRSGATSTSSGPAMDHFSLSLPGPGRFLVAAISTAEHDLNLGVYEGGAPGQGRMLAEDQRVSPEAFADLEIAAEQAVDVYVTSSQAEPYVLKVFRATVQ